MVKLWHVLFLACFPVALLLVAMGQWVAGAAVFLVGTPLFWNLRNRARTMRPEPMRAALVGEPDRYAIPAEVETRLSSSNLDDVPLAVRAGSPRDSTDREVKETLRKLGFLPPGTNYGVVYRACFAPFIEDGEEPLYLRFAWVALGVGHRDNPPKMRDAEEAWVVVTTAAVRWHLVTDRVPGMPPRNPMEAMLPGVREAFYSSGLMVQAGEPQTGPGGTLVRALMLERRDDMASTWKHTIVVAADPSTDALIADVQKRAATPGGLRPL